MIAWVSACGCSCTAAEHGDPRTRHAKIGIAQDALEIRNSGTPQCSRFSGIESRVAECGHRDGNTRRDRIDRKFSSRPTGSAMTSSGLLAIGSAGTSLATSRPCLVMISLSRLLERVEGGETGAYSSTTDVRVVPDVVQDVVRPWIERPPDEMRQEIRRADLIVLAMAALLAADDGAGSAARRRARAGRRARRARHRRPSRRSPTSRSPHRRRSRPGRCPAPPTRADPARRRSTENRSCPARRCPVVAAHILDVARAPVRVPVAPVQ